MPELTAHPGKIVLLWKYRGWHPDFFQFRQYQWCEAKQKCLRPWEEPCAGSASGAMDTSAWKTYRNDTMGFTIKYPPSWAGFTATEATTPAYSHVAFSFYGTHRPFEIFKIVRFSEEQWKTGKTLPFTFLLQADGVTLVCDGCCKEGGDTKGGGQFDAFQQERCAEVPQLLKTLQWSL